MSQAALDKFGLLLMQKVRDIAIEELDRGVRGPAKDKIAKRIQSIIADDQQVKEKILRIIPIAVDTTLHYLLWMLEDEKALKLSIDTPSGVVPSIRDVSDGLSGELYSSKGWIARFSKERYDEIIV